MAAAWLADGLILDPVCLEEPQEHIYRLLGWRYTKPDVSMKFSDNNEAEVVDQCRRTVNRIDRAVWPANFEHIEDTQLKYNQPSGA
jgi:hypothetical protein